MRGRSTDNVPGPKIAIKTKQGVRFIGPAEVIAIQAENNQVLIGQNRLKWSYRDQLEWILYEPASPGKMIHITFNLNNSES